MIRNSPGEADTTKKRKNNEIVVSILRRQEKKEKGLLEIEVIMKLEKSTDC